MKNMFSYAKLEPVTGVLFNPLLDGLDTVDGKAKCVCTTNWGSWKN